MMCCNGCCYCNLGDTYMGWIGNGNVHHYSHELGEELEIQLCYSHDRRRKKFLIRHYGIGQRKMWGEINAIDISILLIII